LIYNLNEKGFPVPFVVLRTVLAGDDQWSMNRDFWFLIYVSEGREKKRWDGGPNDFRLLLFEKDV
jgi:hypothetical protein